MKCLPNFNLLFSGLCGERCFRATCVEVSAEAAQKIVSQKINVGKDGKYLQYVRR